MKLANSLVGSKRSQILTRGCFFFVSEQRAQKVETTSTPMFKLAARKVLSPINSNVNIDPISPIQQYIAEDMTQNTDTPLNKLKAMSCNLKVQNMQDINH